MLETTTEDISYVDLPVKYLDADGNPTVQVEPWPLLDIHDTMGFLFEDAEVSIPTSKLREFWSNSKAFGETWAEEIRSDEMGITVPIGIYGDSARVDTNFGTEHILTIFVNAIMWRPRSVRWSRFLVCAIPETRLTSETIPALLRRIVWSANHAFYGFYPQVGHLGQNLSAKALKRAGKPLTGKGLRFQVVELRGDWQFHKKVWRFHNTNWNAENVCHHCDAKGISDSWPELYWNLDNNNHRDFSLPQFLVHRMPPRRVWD